MEHLVRRAADDDPGQVGQAARTDDDEVCAERIRLVDDLAGYPSRWSVAYDPARLGSLGLESCERSVYDLVRFLVVLAAREGTALAGHHLSHVEDADFTSAVNEHRGHLESPLGVRRFVIGKQDLVQHLIPLPGSRW
jgi:hypothetical protein